MFSRTLQPKMTNQKLFEVTGEVKLKIYHHSTLALFAFLDGVLKIES